MATAVAVENYPALIELINETYLDQVEQIAEARVEDNGDILAVALDGAKQLAVKITDVDISIRLINAAEIDPTGQTSAPDAAPVSMGEHPAFAFKLLQVLDRKVESMAISFSEIESSEALYQALGRRFAAMVLNFAAAPGKAAGKKRNCTKGISCGGTCISAKKTCKKPLTPEVSAKVDATRGAIVLAQRGLATRDGAGAAAGDAAGAAGGSDAAGKTYRNEDIDAAYAKDKPTEADIDGWLNERLAEFTSPEGLAMRELFGKQFSTRPGPNLGWDEQPEYVRELVTRGDRDSFADAAYRKEQETFNFRGRRPYAPEDFGFASEDRIRKAEEKLNNPRVKNKAKAQKDLDKLIEDRQYGETVAARRNEIMALDEATRKEQFRETFDTEVEAQRLRSGELQAKIAKGDIDTIQRETEAMLAPTEDYQDGDGDRNVLDTRKRQRRIARDYLKAVAKFETPEKVLGLERGASPDAVKAAYRAASRKAHPDAGGSAEEFNRVNQAYLKMRQTLRFAEGDDQIKMDLMEIINSVYDDQIEEVLQYRVDADDSILVLGMDGAKQLAARITNGDISIRLVNPDEIDPEGESEQEEAPTAPAQPVNLSDPLTRQPDTVEAFVEQLRRRAQPELTAMLETVRELLNQSSDLQQFSERLDGAYPSLDSETLTAVMAEAMFASRLAGVFEAEQES